jgi:hypothetical protein
MLLFGDTGTRPFGVSASQYIIQPAQKQTIVWPRSTMRDARSPAPGKRSVSSGDGGASEGRFRGKVDFVQIIVRPGLSVPSRGSVEPLWRPRGHHRRIRAPIEHQSSTNRGTIEEQSRAPPMRLACRWLFGGLQRALGWLVGRNQLPSRCFTPCIPPVYPLYTPCIEYAGKWLCHWLGPAFASAEGILNPQQVGGPPGWTWVSAGQTGQENTTILLTLRQLRAWGAFR